MRTETVRVVNPARPDTFMTINRAEFDAGHELWHEQDADFTPPSLPRQTFDPAERDLAVEILNRLVPALYGLPPDAWQAMRGPDRLDRLRAFEADAQGASVEYGRDPHGGRTVAKANGPRGLWYVMWGDQRTSQGFRTEAEALAERDRMSA